MPVSQQSTQFHPGIEGAEINTDQQIYGTFRIEKNISFGQKIQKNTKKTNDCFEAKREFHGILRPACRAPEATTCHGQPAVKVAATSETCNRPVTQLTLISHLLIFLFVITVCIS